MNTTVRKRAFFLVSLVAICFAVIVSRLVIIQIVQASSYAARSRSQTQQRIVLSAPRGAILDVRGRVLARTVEKTIGSQIVNREISEGRRAYPNGELAGAVLGYTGTDGYGLGGVELAFDRYLRGLDGWAIIHRDAKNNRHVKRGLPQKSPVPGSRVFLTIDLGIQRVTQAVLKQAVMSSGARGGMAIVMDPATGSVLAMTSEPGFDPNQAARYSLEQRQNHCISYNFEPGSTFKVVTAASALQEGVLQESSMLDGNNGVYTIYRETIRDKKPRGIITFTEAMSYSSNVCFAKVADNVGNNLLSQYVRDFGFGALTGIRLPGEEKGIVRSMSQWSGRTRVTMAIGQELSVTLIQMATAFAAAANGGILLRPRICDRVIDAQGEVIYSDAYSPVRRVISEDVSHRMRIMLQEVVEKGTGKAAALPGLPVAGKTGTSQKIDTQTGTYYADRHWSSFIGFVPVEKPILLCAVVIDEPALGQSGGEVGAPAFRQIIAQILSSPDLDYAERILRQNRRSDTVSTSQPLLATKDPLPLPQPAVAVDKDLTEEEMASAGIGALGRTPKGGKSIPNVIGVELHEALRTITEHGLVPYVKGSGIVTRQSPHAGAPLQSSAVCTLYCAHRGASPLAFAREGNR